MGWIRGVAAVALLIGPLAWLRRVSNLPVGWHPLLVLCGWAITVLLAGLAGHLRLGALVVVVVSLALLVRELVIDRVNVTRTVREPALLVFAATILGVAVLVHGQLFTHYDNFSHWAMVVEVMLAEGALPTPADEIVTFTTYPLGGATLPYLANLLVGRAEWVSMLAHDTLVLSCALPLFSAAGRRWGAGLVMYGVAALALLTHITSPSSLLVDSLVAALGGALLVLLLLHRQDLLTQPWPLALLATALVTIKSSGILFVAISLVLALLLLLAARDRLRGNRTMAASWAVALGAPWAMWWLWGQHVRSTFPEAAESKHSVSLSRFDTILGEKSRDDITSILGDFAGRAVADERLWLTVVALVLAGAIAVRAGAISAADHRRALLVTLVTVALWELSLMLMYLFSMPRNEALSLAGFARYQGTIRLVVMLVALGIVARWWAQAPVLRPLPVAAVVLAMSVTFLLGSPRTLLNLPNQQLRQNLGQVSAGISIRPEDRVCLLLEGPDGGYRTWMMRYLLLHRDVRAVVVKPDAEKLPSGLGACAVTVLLDPRPHTLELTRQAGVQVGTDPELPLVITP